MDSSLSAMPPMSVEALHQTRYYRQQDLLLRNIHHHLRYPRIQIELLHFLNCIHKSNKEYQWVASKIKKAGFKDQTMNENKEETQEQILETPAVMSQEQAQESLATMIRGQTPEWTKETNEIIETWPMRQVEIMIIKIKQITTIETET